MTAIKNLLQQLYGDTEADAILPQLYSLMDAARAELRTQTGRRQFNEEDIALITYGDTLRDAGRPPLAVLHGFLNRHLKDQINIVHVLPFHPYSSDDGFSVIDYEMVDPLLGEWKHIHQIAADYQLMADFVLNHMSAKSQWFQHYLADEEDFKDLFLSVPIDSDLSSVTRPRISPLLTPFQRNEEAIHVWTTFSADQVDFNYLVPSTMLRMIGILLNYVQHGAQIIRLDAVAYLWKEIGTSSIHLPQTHAFVQLMRAVLDVVAPYVVLLTETNVPHQENISYFGDGHNEAQMVYNFTLPPLLLYSMMRENANLLSQWAANLQPVSEDTTFFNFTASHDGIGVRPLEGIVSSAEIFDLAKEIESKGGRVSYRSNADGSQSPYELNITYVDAIIDPGLPEAQQVQQFIVSQAIALALQGVPGIYIHSLLGSHNDKEGVERLGHNRAINRAKLHVKALEAALTDENSFRAKIFSAYQQLLNLRRASPYFNPQIPHEVLDVSNPAVFALSRRQDAQHKLIALHNISRRPQQVDISPYSKAEHLYDLLSQNIYQTGTITLPPFGVLWLEEK